MSVGPHRKDKPSCHSSKAGRESVRSTTRGNILQNDQNAIGRANKKIESSQASSHFHQAAGK